MATERIRKEVRNIILERGLEQQRVAQTAGLPPENLSRLLNGKSGALNTSWCKALDALGLELTVVPRE